jgi:hypothetical protein
MDGKGKFIHGYLCVGQSEYAFVAKFDQKLLDYLKSGRGVKAKDLEIFVPWEGESKDGN